MKKSVLISFLNLANFTKSEKANKSLVNLVYAQNQFAKVQLKSNRNYLHRTLSIIKKGFLKMALTIAKSI